ncbi:MAG: cofactor-independent phosphoglycerate mutase [Kiritimatiellae bacterium]|nr:cofactor-independent phosphoglycerate mutase [Kiritimatiellia bacterium]
MQNRKCVILIGDGMGDYPQAELSGKTPLQSALIPNMRAIAAAGEARLVTTVPQGMPAGSDVANLCIMGFDPKKYYTGRAPIEAAGAGIELAEGDVAFRCNLITVENELITDHSAGHISTEEARPLIELIQNRLGNDGKRFFTGKSYRHLLVWKNGPHDGLVTTPPHDVLGQPAAKNAPRGPRAEEVLRLMEESKKIIGNRAANEARKKAGQNTATQIWLWGQGRSCVLPSYRKLFGLTGGVVTAVDLVRGIGRLAGLEAGIVQGATGFIDTDYAAKVRAALVILEKHDFVFVHVEAPDECSHNGDLRLKIRAIEDFDRMVVGPVWRALNERGQNYRLIIGTDHRTPVNIRNHTAEPVPMAVVDGPVAPPDGARVSGRFDEFISGGRDSGMAYKWLRQLLGKQAPAYFSRQEP